MEQLTIRGFDKELERRMLSLARSEGLSLNRAALRLMRRGAGLIEPGQRKDTIGDALDSLAGTWTAGEEEEFLEAIKPFATVDEEFWR
jgi:hypothetical protein